MARTQPRASLAKTRTKDLTKTKVKIFPLARASTQPRGGVAWPLVLALC